MMNRSISQLWQRGRWVLLALGLSIVSVVLVNLNSKAAAPETVEFYARPTSSIASAVAVPGGRGYFWTSGTVPPPLDRNAPAGSRERYGDTKTQALGTLKRIEERLQQVGLTISDVIYLRVYLVADKFKDNQIDYQGWFDAYKEYFNNSSNPNKVARSTVGVAGLVVPDWLIEIEAVAVFPE
ncbi:MAG: RidA family protein [Hormoscilla sp. GUM202]|nr:RidA family protein [Hormoscilla sp. GUM202]